MVECSIVKRFYQANLLISRHIKCRRMSASVQRAASKFSSGLGFSLGKRYTEIL